MRGPAIFLAQFVRDAAPYNEIGSIAAWAASLGYRGVQIPTWERGLFDLELAARSRDYCDTLKGTLAEVGIEITELSTHLQGQLVAVNPVYDVAFDGFAPAQVRGNPAARQEWAVEQLALAAQASAHLGLAAHATFSGALAWPFLYPWPPRPTALVDTAFAELARRWRPILDRFDQMGVDVCFEIHPGEDLHDGVTFERFLEATGHHPRCAILYDPSHLLLQGMDYVGFIDVYHERIRAFHVKDAEFRPDARSGAYGGYQGWVERPGRFRSLGDGQIDFGRVFSRLTQHGYAGWAVLEWECAVKASGQGAAEGAPFIARHLITPASGAFDDFAGGDADPVALRAMLGLGSQR